MKLLENFMKILSAFCVFLFADRQTHMERLLDTSLENHLKHSTKVMVKNKIVGTNTI